MDALAAFEHMRDGSEPGWFLSRTDRVERMLEAGVSVEETRKVR